MVCLSWYSSVIPTPELLRPEPSPLLWASARLGGDVGRIAWAGAPTESKDTPALIVVTTSGFRDQRLLAQKIDANWDSFVDLTLAEAGIQA
jgi:hypothetical protein